MPESPTRRSFLRRWLAAAAATPAVAALAGCSASAVVNVLTPARDYTRQNDLAYGSDPRQRLDVYVPDQRTAEPPVVVFFYGGRWQHGTRDFYAFVGEALASRGAVVVIADYRVWPEVGFPVFVDDGAAVIAWTRKNIATHGGNPDRIIVAGHSAGAHIAALLALDRSYLLRAGAPGAVIAFMGLAGPYDFLPLTDPDLKALFGPPAGLAATQPINFARADAPPMWLGHGTADTTVLPRNSIHLTERAHALGAPATLKLYDGYGHIGIIARLAAALRSSSTILDDMSAFIASVPAKAQVASL